MRVHYEERVDWIDLSAHALPWSDDGLRNARELVGQRQRDLAVEGWLSSYSDRDFGVLQLRSRARRGENAGQHTSGMIIGLRLRSQRSFVEPAAVGQ